MMKLQAGKLYAVATYTGGQLGFATYAKRSTRDEQDGKVRLNEGDVVMYAGCEPSFMNGFICGLFISPDGQVICRHTEQSGPAMAGIEDFDFFIEAQKKTKSCLT